MKIQKRRSRAFEKFINMPQVLTDFAFKSAVEAVLAAGYKR